MNQEDSDRDEFGEIQAGGQITQGPGDHIEELDCIQWEQMKSFKCRNWHYPACILGSHCSRGGEIASH